MNGCIPSPSNVGSLVVRNRAYETNYKREFALKKSSSINEGIPPSQRYLLGRPFELSGPIGNSVYGTDFVTQSNVNREPAFRPNTNRANRPHPHKQFPYWPRRVESSCDLSTEETDQTLKNQINSTYRVDFTGATQGFSLPLAFDRSHPYWRDRAKHTLDSEYRNRFQDLPKQTLNFGGRYHFSPKKPADAVVPQTVPVWKTVSLDSIYGHEISQKAPKVTFAKEFVDSLNGPLA